MTPEQLCLTVQKRHENGESYEKIAGDLHISKPAARRLALGEKPSKRLVKLLQLDPPEPSAKLKATRERREKLDAIARSWKYKSWANYETVCIREMNDPEIDYDLS